MTHLFVGNHELGGTAVFYNGEAVAADRFESLSVEIIAPDDTQEGSIVATLSRYPEGGGAPQGSSIFPGTVEVIGKTKRVSVTCSDLESFDGLYLRFGMGDDGGGAEASGVGRFRLVVTPNLLDARMTWAEDGREDVILF